MEEPPSPDAAEFFDRHSGITVDAESAVAAAAWNQARLERALADLREHPLDLDGVPDAETVLTALPEGLHPLVIADFFTQATTSLVMDEEPVSVRDWLTRGGDLETVVHLAECLPGMG